MSTGHHDGHEGHDVTRPEPASSGLTRRGLLAAGGATGLAALLAGCGLGGASSTGGQGSGKGSIRALFMKQAGYSEDNIRAMTAGFQKANPSIKVTADFVSYEALHDKIVAAAPAGTYDVVLIDVIWPAEFGTKHIVADVSAKWPASWKQKMLPGAVATPEFDNKMYGVPWILDTKYLYYNTAHLQKAKVDPGSLDTWDGVMKAARAVKSAGLVKYPLIWSWQQAEALICDYAQLLGAFGGSFLDSSGKPAFNKGGGVQALEFMQRSLTDGLSNPTSTQSLEEDVRRVFSAGQASMALNWTYMFGLADDPKQSQVPGKVGVAQTPTGSAGRPGVNGSMALAVAGGSKNQSAAWKYVSYLTSQPVQDKFALSSLPVWKTSYDDPHVVKTNPAVVPQAKKQLGDLILRPQVKNYNGISQILQAEIQNVLLKKKTPQQGLDDAASKASALLQS
ncbi:MAG: multiple sugar transport system substrate-binding protein [Nocardioidaceae bacterium]|nr:multiple sugar transport system substrate-binding protein [Nocardioidaceae bacterium]